MRKEILVITGIVLLISAVTTQAEITDVFIFPEEPIEIDPITISVFGVEPYNISITDTIFTVNETFLDLDIYFELGNLTVVTPWSHSEDIGFLGVGIYELTVNTINELEPEFNDSYYTTFEVTPEPATILLFGLGAIVFRTF